MQTLDIAQMYSYDRTPWNNFHDGGDTISRKKKNTRHRLRHVLREIDFWEEY
jgi:hypothetical protein